MFKFILKPLGNAMFEEIKKEKRLVGSRVSFGIGKDMVDVKLVKLGDTIRSYLGDNGEVYSAYYPKEKRLLLSIVFSYPRNSKEGEIIDECSDVFVDNNDDGLGIFDIHHLEIVEITDKNLTEVILTVNDVKKKDIALAAGHLYSRAFNWLDIVYDDIEEANA